MYRGRPSWNCPWEGAIQLGQGEGPIGIVGPISQPCGPTAPRHSRWNVLAHLRALSEPTLLWAAKGVLYPHVGGTETHRAHSHPIPDGLGVWKIIKILTLPYPVYISRPVVLVIRILIYS